ncbi:hypothetical protein J1781_01255 [Rahnella sp. C60]|nr:MULTISPECIES: hypothetical protein [Rahnella]MBU9809297.1 hypothetical protein [Rahnella perminowiae]MBU9813486.1 hypothetical protein [Rahnella perminowiae]MBU9848997.1 hypothetical protein [Rahnella aceris]MBU9858766.1 hypothetical protein [Rahnella aceris]MCX2944388.1 hypothetical protein [Rahnella perminowiae]
MTTLSPYTVRRIEDPAALIAAGNSNSNIEQPRQHALASHDGKEKI